MLRFLALLMPFTIAKPQRGEIVRGGTTHGKKLAESGFVTCSNGQGDEGTLEQAIRRLRALGNSDPVEVFHVGGVLDDEAKTKLSQISRVHVVSLESRLTKKEVSAVAGETKKYMQTCRTMALLHAGFAKVIGFDPETTFLSNPSHIWNHPVLANSGMLFFYDRPEVDGGFTSQTHSKLCDELEEFMHEKEISMEGNFRENHKELCSGTMNHFQSSSVFAYDMMQPKARETLKMLKDLHQHLLLAKRIGDYGEHMVAEKELHWIAAEMVGETKLDMFTPAGPPQVMLQKSTMTEDACNCLAQVDPADPQKLLFVSGFHFWTARCSGADSVTVSQGGHEDQEKCNVRWLKRQKLRPILDNEKVVMRSFGEMWI